MALSRSGERVEPGLPWQKEHLFSCWCQLGWWPSAVPLGLCCGWGEAWGFAVSCTGPPAACCC